MISKMKRYALFTWQSCYPEGGWNDLHDTFDTAEEAAAVGEEEVRKVGSVSPEWWEVVDLETGATVGRRRGPHAQGN